MPGNVKQTHFLKETYSDWDMLTYSEHHGLATRLLYCGFNPFKVAAFLWCKHMRIVMLLFMPI
ncbi:hypothetical protein ACVPOR_14000 [Staphylococcus aureus]